ncbi:MAG: OmpA family protein [Candidatus Omnitrophota bacterium]
MMKDRRLRTFLVLTAALFLSGCATWEKAGRADDLNYELAMTKKKMDQLKKDHQSELEALKSAKDAEIERLRKEKQQEVKSFAEKKDRELSDLERAKRDLERKLKDEIGDYRAKLQMTERGLVVTFLSEIFFDPGKDVIKPEGEQVLAKVAQILNAEIVDSNIAVEGHTDNTPIKTSGWKSNWELSTARSLSVVHYFIEQGAVGPKRLSAVGYGEYKPVKPNDFADGRSQNRRVEIVILPAHVQKIKQE